jgi:molybdenum cofactor cytidylyltransferase
MPSARTPRLTAGVVLAAGSSVRLGRNKLLLELGGETLVRRAVRTAIAAALDPVIVVLGHEAERVACELAALPCLSVVNADHALGAGTSLRRGVDCAMKAGAGALVLTLADMPLVTPEMIHALVTRHEETGAKLVVSHYGETQAPPSLFGRALFEELLTTDDERCGKSVIRRHAGEAVVAHWPEAMLRDLDVPSDYEELRAQLAAR